MATFDMHLHLAFKQALAKYEPHYPTTRSSAELVQRFKLRYGLPALLDEHVFHFLAGQSCVDQVLEAAPVFGSASIVPLERFATHRNGLFGKLLNGPFTDPLDKDYMDAIRDGEVSYYQLFIKELSIYRRLALDGRINWVTRRNNKDLEQRTGINVTLSMEGGHGLCRSRIGKAGWDDERAPLPTTPPTDWPAKDHVWDDFTGKSMHPADSLTNLQQALWKDGLDLMYLTLTHLSHIDEQFLATHAYGMKMLNTREVRPQGNGLSEMGRAVVKAAYALEVHVDASEGSAAEKVPAPVMIDIKHMGLKSRLDLYAYRRELQAQGMKLPPILASHMGVTGYSIAEWKGNLVRGSVRVEGSPRSVALTINRRHAGNWGLVNRGFTFNAWSINMMDEDIVEVLASGGLIGISLDVRVLGWNDLITKDEMEEFLSPEDFRHFFPEEALRVLGPAEGMGAESWMAPTKEERHPLAFCFNLLHVISVGLMAGHANVWKRVCVGSDFDGLIDPLKNVSDASLFKGLPALLQRWLPVAEKAYREANGGPVLLPRDTRDRIDDGKLSDVIKDFVGVNGRDFLQNEWK